jgi:hypothetical protein
MSHDWILPGVAFELDHHMRRGTLQLTSTNIRRRFDNIPKLVCQIIFTAHRASIHGDARTDWGRWDRHDRQFGPCVLWRQTKEVEIRVHHFLKTGYTSVADIIFLSGCFDLTSCTKLSEGDEQGKRESTVKREY